MSSLYFDLDWMLSCTCTVHTCHYSHLDGITFFASLAIPQQLNIMADTLAKQALHEIMEKGDRTTPHYPFHLVWFYLHIQEVTYSSARCCILPGAGVLHVNIHHSRRRQLSAHLTLIWSSGKGGHTCHGGISRNVPNLGNQTHLQLLWDQGPTDDCQGWPLLLTTSFYTVVILMNLPHTSQYA